MLIPSAPHRFVRGTFACNAASAHEVWARPPPSAGLYVPREKLALPVDWAPEGAPGRGLQIKLQAFPHARLRVGPSVHKAGRLAPLSARQWGRALPRILCGLPRPCCARMLKGVGRFHLTWRRPFESKCSRQSLVTDKLPGALAAPGLTARWQIWAATPEKGQRTQDGPTGAAMTKPVKHNVRKDRV
jgi:hypothetical protein